MSNKKYRRKCDNCGRDYHGYGEKFCSVDCANAAQADDPVEFAPDPGEPSLGFEEDDSGLTVTGTCRLPDSIHTLEQFIDYAEVDTDTWEVDLWKTWSSFMKDKRTQQPVRVILFSVRFKKIAAKPVLDAIDAALGKMEAHAPKYDNLPALIIPDTERHFLEFVMPDPHFGKYSWSRETGENVDTEITRERYLWSIRELIQRKKHYPIEGAGLVIGNDLLQANNYEGETARGTRVDTDGRHAKVIETVYDTLVEAVELFVAQGWWLKVVTVMGNHDPEETLHAGRYLRAWFRNCDRIEVDAEPNPRKYLRYGVNLLGFTHGNEENIKELPTIMAVEQPEDWHHSRFREWHLGHIHKKKELAPVVVDEKLGVRIRHLSAITGKDAWHHKRGYMGIKSAEAFVWHHKNGLVDIAVANTPGDNESVVPVIRAD